LFLPEPGIVAAPFSSTDAAEARIRPKLIAREGLPAARVFFALCCIAFLALAIPALPAGAPQPAQFGFTSKAQAQEDDEGTPLPGLEAPAQIVRDGLGVPHIYAKSERDAYFLVGYVQAQDRLFQMDQSRRQASGTLAELLGSGALASDVQLRTLGLRRAAERSLDAISEESVHGLGAYSNGVNAWLNNNPLPSEYAALELTKAQVPAWTPLDTMAVTKLLAFGLSFGLEDIDNTQRLVAYQTAGAQLGFDGDELFFEDVMRSEPFAHAPSILSGEAAEQLQKQGQPPLSSSFLDSDVGEAAEEVLNKAKEAGIPVEPPDQGGSNIWVVSGANSASGRPMVASDPHLALGSPPTFYEAGIDIGANPNQGLSLYGVTFPGTPLLVHGTNGHVSWGSTVNPTDVTDVYQEELVVAGGVPVATRHEGITEPTEIIPEIYRANQPGNGTQDDVAIVPSGGNIPAATIVVPRRNNGPLISVTPVPLSVQYTGFSATREPDFFRLLSRAHTVGEAIDAQRFFDFGAQNWMYVDDRGNIGYKTSGEIPLREDLQAGAVDGLPPYFIRDGTGGNEWIADETHPADQALDYEILPFEEMDGLVNPARGWISNANQDPTGQTFDNDPLNELRAGGGIRYISPGHADGNRNTRISARIEEALAGGVSFEEMESIQADVKLNDAKVLVPYITAAFEAAQAPSAPPQLATLGSDPKVQEAVARLAAWDFSTPTGIQEGYDASDVAGARAVPTQAEIEAGIATTIYSLWRGRVLKLIVDDPLAARGLGGFLPGGDQAMSALRHLLEVGGTGASGIEFFAGPVERDTAVLQAVKNALDLAAGPGFAAAFGQSANLADYRWGYLHRKVFGHTLGGPFSIPPGAGFENVGPGLSGVATDGGFGVVDASSHNPRASALNAFMFGSGPARRFVAEARPSHPNAVQVIPGGESGNPLGGSGDPLAQWFGNQLGLWLTNEYHGATTVRGEVLSEATLQQEFVPAP
jgi:penicillin G amidase